MNTVVLRPWGYYKPAYESKDISITELTVKPEQKTELARRPNHKSSWVIVSGECDVLLEDDSTVRLKQHDHYLLPENIWYQMTNSYAEPCKIVEITYNA